MTLIPGLALMYSKNCGAFDKCQVLHRFSRQGFEETKDVFHVLMKDNTVDGVLNGATSDPKRSCPVVFCFASNLLPGPKKG